MEELPGQLAKKIKLALEAKWKAEVKFENIKFLTGGASNKTYYLEARPGNKPLAKLIIRIAGHKSGSSRLETERKLLSYLYKNKVKVPRVICFIPQGEDAPAALVTNYIEGETIPKKLFADKSFVSNRLALAEEIAKSLASIHLIDTTKIPEIKSQDELSVLRYLLDSIEIKRPVLELAWQYLNHTKPKDIYNNCLVHGDFRMGNLIIKSGHLKSILDWEICHTGSCYEDLGWFCVKAWRFSSNLEAGGLCSIKDFLRFYEKYSHKKINMAQLKWWIILGSLKWGIYSLLQGNLYLQGRTASIENLAIARRTTEQEWDLLNLLSPKFHSNHIRRLKKDLSKSCFEQNYKKYELDIGSVNDLLKACFSFFEQYLETMPKDASKYFFQVTLNLLNIAIRELSSYDENRAKQKKIYASLTVESDHSLWLKVKDADFSELKYLFNPLIELTFQRLLIANPDYI